MNIRRALRTGLLAGFTGTAADLNAASGVAVAATITPGAEVAHVITTTITLKDSAGNAVGESMAVQAWLSDTAKGALTATAPTSATVVASGTARHILTANEEYEMLTTAGGVMSFTTTQTVAHNYYWNVRLPNGKIASGLVAHAG